MRRDKRVGISTGLLLACVSGTTCWLLANVWAQKQVTIQEPRFPVIVVEVISLGLVALLGLFSMFYFWKIR